MGMVFIGRALSASELEAVRADPVVASTLLFADRFAEPVADPHLRVDVDKAWHGIHYLLTGTVWERGDGLGAAILGGDPIAEDAGYGPPRLLDPETVSTVAEALTEVDVDALRGRYDPAVMMAAGIYPDIWDEGDEPFDGYLAPNFLELRRFYQAAAAGGQAVLVAIT